MALGWESFLKATGAIYATTLCQGLIPNLPRGACWSWGQGSCQTDPLSDQNLIQPSLAHQWCFEYSCHVLLGQNWPQVPSLTWLGIRPGSCALWGYSKYLHEEEGVLQSRQPLGLEAEPYPGTTNNWIQDPGPTPTTTTPYYPRKTLKIG